MKKSARKNLIAATSVAALIAAAIVCRYLAHSENFPTALIKALDIVRTFIYLGLFGGWGVTVYRRVMQTQARKLLVITAALMILWLMLRAYKYYFVAGETAIRFLWYAYYIPTVLIPTFSLLVATSLGEKDGYKLPKLAFAAFIPASSESSIMYMCGFVFKSFICSFVKLVPIDATVLMNPSLCIAMTSIYPSQRI